MISFQLFESQKYCLPPQPTVIPLIFGLALQFQLPKVSQGLKMLNGKFQKQFISVE